MSPIVVAAALLVPFLSPVQAAAASAANQPDAVVTDCAGLAAEVAAQSPAQPATPAAAGVYDGVRLSSAQVTTARTIAEAGKDLKVSRRGVRIAIAVAMQESSLNPAAVSGPFIGLFQQQSDPASGLYTKGDRTDAAESARMFFEQLVKRVPGYDTDARSDWEIGEAVQETNVGRNVLQWFTLSQQLTDKFLPAPPPPAPKQPKQSPKVVVTTAATVTVSRPLTRPFALRANGLALAEPTANSTEPAVAPTGSTEESASEATSSADTTQTGAATTGAAATGAATTAATTTVATTGPEVTGDDPSPTSTAPSVTDSGTESTTPSTAGSSTAPQTSTAATGPTTTATTPTTPAPATPTTSVSSRTQPPTTIDPTPATPKPSVTTGKPPVTHVPPPVVDTPAPPIPSGTDDDPDVGPGAPGENDTPGSDGPAQGGPAQLDCSPDTNGRSTAFDPGMIISDQVFYNSGAMKASEVQAFLDRLGAACVGPECLRSYRVTTSDLPADKYCKAYQGAENESVAVILTKLSVACGINPQVMLTTLQKESGLLTRTGVDASDYAAVYGWHCPDTGPGGSANCDPAYAGFFRQAAGMAKQWSRYRVDPDKYNYRAGQTVKILWNVAESGCGGATVNIRNTATASLYNYTPYQPNAASLAAYPSVGDRCSSYGNRNFFMLFSKYFGVTGGGAAAQIAVNGVNVTIPTGPTVAAGAAGKVIKAPNAAVARALAAGFAALGLPYVYGGGTAGGGADQGCARAGGASNSCQGIVGFDCSGLTGYVLAKAGVSIPDYSGAQRTGGTDVSWAQGLPGDIIGYQGHVAIYLGVIDGVPYLLEAPTVGMSVQVRPVYHTNGGVAVDSVLHRYWS